MAKEQKTNVMRILDKAHITYTEHTYDSKDGAIDLHVRCSNCIRDIQSRSFSKHCDTRDTVSNIVFVILAKN